MIKRVLKAVVIMITLINGINLSDVLVEAGPNDPVNIPDANFKKCINTILNQGATATVTESQMASIVNLACAHSSISSIEGAQYLTNLDVVSLKDNQISDISPLSGLQIRELGLGNNRISDLSTVDWNSNTDLQHLYLDHNQISDITPLAVLRVNRLFTLYLIDQKVYLPSKNITTTPYQISASDLSTVKHIDGSTVSYSAGGSPLTSFANNETKTLSTSWNSTISYSNFMFPNLTAQFNGVVYQQATYSLPITMNASNFMIDIDDVGGLTDALAKTKANVSASQVGNNITNLVTANTTQLNTIKKTNATGAYDLSFSVTSSGVTETKTVRVLVVDDNTIVNVNDNIVLYAYDFTVPLSSASGYTQANALSDSNIKAYKYSDGTLLSNSNVTVDVDNINDAVVVGPVDVEIEYNDGIVNENTKVIASIIDSDTEVNNGNEEAIYAKDFTIHKDDVSSLTDAIVKSKAGGAKAWNIATGNSVALSVGRSAIQPQIGSYGVEFKTVEGTTKTIRVTVVDDNTVNGTNYMLSTTNFKIHIDDVATLDETIILNKSETKTWKISDNSPATGKITANTVTSNVGIYKVEVYVHEEPATKKDIFVTVYDDETVLGNMIAIDASNFSIDLNNVGGITEAGVVNDASVQAWDMLDGSNLTSTVEVDTTEFNTIKDTSTLGVYDLTFSVTKHNETVEKTVKVFVTNSNTVINPSDDIVLYANDIIVDLEDAPSYSSGLVDSEAKAYKYSDGSGLSVSNISVDHININNAVVAGPVNAIVTYDDGAITETTTIVASIVDDNTVINNGDNEAIVANNFRLTVAEATALSDNDVVTKSNALAWNMNDGSTLTLNVDRSAVIAVSGVYPVVLSTPGGLTTKTVYAIVGEEIVFSNRVAIGADNFVIDVDDVSNLDLTEAVTKSSAEAWDLTNGSDITSDVVVDTIELDIIKNTTAIGVYDLTFSVTKHGETVEKTVKVYVVDDNTVVNVNNDIVLYANDFNVDLDDASTYSNGVVDSDAKAYKYSDGSVLPVSNISLDHININNAATVGPVNAQVTYDDGVITETTIVIASIYTSSTVHSNGIMIDTTNYVVHIDDISTHNPVVESSALAWNMSDGSAVNVNVESSSLTALMNVKSPGRYEVEYIADNGSESVSKTGYVFVIDDSSVVINGKVLYVDRFRVEISADTALVFTLEDLVELTNARAYDIATGEALKVNLKQKIELDIVNNGKVGEYEVVLKVNPEQKITVVVTDDSGLASAGAVNYIGYAIAMLIMLFVIKKCLVRK